MANFVAARFFFLSRGVRTHYFLVPLLYMGKNGYKSSGPVSFIPRSFAQIKKTPSVPALQSPAKEDGIEVQHVALAPGNSASGLSNFDGSLLQEVNFDDETMNVGSITRQIGEFSEFEEDIEPLGELLDINDGSMHAVDTISEPDGNECIRLRKEAEQLAVELLAARAFTATELQKKLRSKKYPLHLVESIVDDFKSRGLLNDGLYAESFTRSRWLSSTWGPIRIKYALQRKGVNKTDAEKARKLVFEDNEHECDGQALLHGMSKLSRDLLFAQVSKQWLRSQNTCLENRRTRIVRWLQYRGFNWGVISYTLRKLESQYPS